MEEEIDKALSVIEDSLYFAACNLEDARNQLQIIQNEFSDREKTEIKSIENFKTKGVLLYEKNYCRCVGINSCLRIYSV